jgi:hypothetical protein
MAYLCEQIAGSDFDLSPTCIVHLWIFQNLEVEEIEALSREGCGKNRTRTKRYSCKGTRSMKCF